MITDELNTVLDWSKLSMRDRAAFIRLAVANGYKDVDSIHLAYNEYKGGGYKGKTLSDSTVKKAMLFFINKGLTEALAAGLVGNLYRESNLNPKAINPSSKAYGIALWLGPRKKRLFETYGTNPTLQLQLNFVWDELNSTHKNGLRYLMNSKSPEEAAKNAMGYYEFMAGPEGAIKEMKKWNLDGERSMALGIKYANLLYGSLQDIPYTHPNVSTRVEPAIKAEVVGDKQVLQFNQPFFNANSIPQSTLNNTTLVSNIPATQENVGAEVETIEPTIQGRDLSEVTVYPEYRRPTVSTVPLFMLLPSHLENLMVNITPEKQPVVKSKAEDNLLSLALSDELKRAILDSADGNSNYTPQELALLLEDIDWIKRMELVGLNNLAANGGRLYPIDGNLVHNTNSLYVSPIEILPEEIEVSPNATLRRSHKVFSNYDEAKDNPLSSFTTTIRNAARWVKDNVIDIPSGVSNCTLSASLWIDPANPIKNASSIIANPEEYNYIPIEEKDARLGDVLITRNPNDDSYHTMVVSGYTPKEGVYNFDGTDFAYKANEPLLTYSRGGHDVSFIRRNIPLSVYMPNSDGKTEKYFYRYERPNTVLNALLKKSKGGNLFAPGGEIEDEEYKYATTYLPEIIVTAPRQYIERYDENGNPIYTTDLTKSMGYNAPILQSHLDIQETLKEKPNTGKQWADLATQGIGLALAPIAAAPVVEAGLPIINAMARPLTTTAKVGSKLFPSWSKALPYTEMADRGIMGYMGARGVYDTGKEWYNGEIPWYQAVPQMGLSGLMIADAVPLVKSTGDIFKNIYNTTNSNTVLNRLVHPIESIKMANMANKIMLDYSNTLRSAFKNQIKNTKFFNAGNASYYPNEIHGLKNASDFRRAHELGHLFQDAIYNNGILFRPILPIPEYQYTLGVEPDINTAEHFADLFGVKYSNDYNTAKVIKSLGKDYLTRIPVVVLENPANILIKGVPEPLPYNRGYLKLPSLNATRITPLSPENAATIQRQMGDVVMSGTTESTIKAAEKGRNTLLDWIRNPFYRARLKEEPLHRVANDVVTDAEQMLENVSIRLKDRMQLSNDGTVLGTTTTRPAVEEKILPDGTKVINLNTGLDVDIAADLGENADETTLHELLHYMTANSKGSPVSSNAGERIINKGWMEPTETHFDAINIIHKNRSKGWQNYILDQNNVLLPKYDKVAKMVMENPELAKAYLIKSGRTPTDADAAIQSLRNRYSRWYDIQEQRAYLQGLFLSKIKPNLKNPNDAAEIEAFLTEHPEVLAESPEYKHIQDVRPGTLKQYAEYFASALSTLPFIIKTTKE